MPAIQDIFTEYYSIIADFDISKFTALCNRAIGEISGQVLLPALETIDTVISDTARPYVDLPADFQRNLRYCHSETNNRRIPIKGSVTLLYKDIANISSVGAIQGVAVKGNTLLYYYPQNASAETLTLHYWAKPSEYIETDTPYVLPDHLQTPLLLNYALWKSFAQIEDGIDGQKINTNYYQNEYKLALGDLVMFIGPENSIPVGMEDDIHFEAYLS